jgi:hypothetical protein
MAVREARILVGYRESAYRLCKLAWSKTDASFYIFPYATAGLYSLGRHSVPNDSAEATVPFDQQETSTMTPKLSIHESGQVHIKVGGSLRVGPLQTVALADLRGDHVATVTCSRFESLPRHTGPIRSTGSEADLVIPSDAGVESGRLAIYVNGASPSFPVPVRFILVFQRPTLSQTLFVGVAPISQRQLSEEPEAPGAVLIAGWNPRADDPSSAADFLFIVGR